ncbi:MAG TPA: hypothetical protein VFL77_11040 [Solirubrobacterales bacterium]|nr:hypothetical protein [Solirubrobacterales bacterium]
MTTTALVTGVAFAGTTEKPLVIRSGNLIMKVNGNAAPTRLPKYKLTPVSFHASGTIETADGSHPPALQEVLADVGKTAVIKAADFPTCTSGKLQATTTARAEATCKDAIVGRGTAQAEIAFPEQAPIPVRSPLLIMNGGEKDGKVTLFVHAYITVPTPATLITTITITRIHKGVYRLHTVSKLPKIAGGAGSLTSFYFNMNRKGYLWANCDNGHFAAHIIAKFSDGTTVSGSFIRPCIGT